MLPRVLFVSDSAERTGPTTSLVLLAKYLRNRFDCHVLFPGHGVLPELLRFEGIPSTGFRSLRKWELPRLVRFVWKGEFDLIYGNLLSSATKNALIASKVMRLPFIYHIRSMVGSARRQTSASVRFADAVVAVSRAASLSLTPLASPTKIHVVHNGVELAEWTKDRAGDRGALLLRLGLSDDAVILLALGNVDSRKAPEHAVRALGGLVKKYPLTHLVLAGRLDRDPKYAARLRELVSELGLDEHVSIMGFLEHVAPVVRGSDILVHTAISDPHPRAVVEAMAAGLPVVAFAVDGVAETVLDGVTGRLVTAHDANALDRAMGDLISQPALRQQYGRASRARAKRAFCAERSAKAVGDIIEGVLRGVVRRKWSA